MQAAHFITLTSGSLMCPVRQEGPRERYQPLSEMISRPDRDFPSRILRRGVAIIHQPPEYRREDRGTSLDEGIETVVSLMPILSLAGGVTAAIAGVVMAIDDLLPDPELGTNPERCRVEHCDGVQDFPSSSGGSGSEP